MQVDAPSSSSSPRIVDEENPARRTPSTGASTATVLDARPTGETTGEASVQPRGPDADDAFLVTFRAGDTRDPRQWSETKKWFQLCLYLLPEVWAQVISTIFAPAVPATAEAVHVSEAAVRTVQAIYLYGFAVGPVFAAPISENYGRRNILLLSVLIIALCQIPCAFAPSIGLLLPFRFIAGMFAATTFNSIGVVGDLWDPRDQAWGVNSFALAAEAGVYLGGIIGGFVVASIGWQWVFGVAGLGMAAVLLIVAPLLAETRGGVLLARDAAHMRKETGDERYYAAHEREVKNTTIKDVFTDTVGRPVWMLFTEPIVAALSIYDGINYMVIYLFANGFELIYKNTYGWPITSQNLPFLSLLVGAILAYLLLPVQRAWERRAVRKSPTGDLEPEDRWGWLLVANPLFPISLFWFAWTAIPAVHWSSSIIALALFGFSSHIIFVAVSDVTVACYSRFAASAIGAQSLLRELLSGSANLFTTQGYTNLGYPYYGTLIACIAVFVSTFPYPLWWYGSVLRSRSPFCVEQMAEQKRKAQQGPSREQDEKRARNDGEDGSANQQAPAIEGQDPATSSPERGESSTEVASGAVQHSTSDAAAESKISEQPQTIQQQRPTDTLQQKLSMRSLYRSISNETKRRR